MQNSTSKGTKSREKADLSAGKLMCSRDVRKDQIERQIADYQRMNKKGLSMRQIAKRVGMYPGTHLMSILWDMTEESRLIAKPRDYRPGITAWDFKLPPDRLSRLNF